MAVRTAAELKALLSRTKSPQPSEFDQVLELLLSFVPDDASSENPLVSVGGGGDLGTLDDVTNWLDVKLGAPGGGDGSQANPFNTIAAAVDLIIANDDASPTNRYGIRLSAGTFVENVRARLAHTTIKGAGRDLTFIAPTSGMGFYGGNATEASLDAFETAGSPAKASVDTDYVDLVKDSALPEITGNVLCDLTISKHTSNYTDLMIMNVGDGDSVTALGWELRNVYVAGDSYFRNVVILKTNECELRYECSFRNVRSWTQDDGKLGNVTAKYDAAQPKPGAGLGTISLIQLNDVFGYDNVHLDNCYYRLEEIQINNTLTLKDCVGSTATIRDIEANNIVLEGSTHANTILQGARAFSGLQINNPVAINATLTNPDIGTGGITAASGGTNNVQIKGGTVLGPIVDPDDYISYTAPTDQRVVDIDFTAQPTADIKGSGDGNYPMGGKTFAATNTAGATQAVLTNGTGLVLQAASDQRLLPADDITLAPQVRASLSSLISNLGISEADGLRIWCRLDAASLTGAAETCGFGLVSSGAAPARFIAVSKRFGGIYLDHHCPITDAAVDLLDADNSPTVLILEKSLGIDQWGVRVGAWSSGWPALSSTTLLGYVHLSTQGTSLVSGAALLKYSDLDLVLYNSNVAPSPTTSYSHPLSTGDRTATIGVESSLPVTPGPANSLVNGNEDDAGQTHWATTQPAAGEYLRFDFGAPYIVNEMQFKGQSGGPSYGVWKWQGSNDESGWTDLSANFTFTPTATFYAKGDMSANTTAYRWYQLLGISGNADEYGWWYEARAKVADAAVADMVATFKNLRLEPF